MQPAVYSILAVLILAVTSMVLLISPDWRMSILALAVQYIGVFILVSLHWPFAQAVSKLVAGWMAGAILGMAMTSLPQEPETVPPSSRPGLSLTRLPGVYSRSGRLFRLMAAILVWLFVLSTAPHLVQWLPEWGLEQVWGGLLLIGMGLLQLGFTAQPFRTVIGLLTVLAGFGILYAVVESSALVAGLLAGVDLLLALTGSYLLLSPQMEENE